MDTNEFAGRVALHASAIAMRCAVELSKVTSLSDDARETLAVHLLSLAALFENIGTDDEAAAYHLAARAVRENNRTGSQGARSE